MFTNQLSSGRLRKGYRCDNEKSNLVGLLPQALVLARNSSSGRCFDLLGDGMKKQHGVTDIEATFWIVDIPLVAIAIVYLCYKFVAWF